MGINYSRLLGRVLAAGVVLGSAGCATTQDKFNRNAEDLKHEAGKLIEWIYDNTLGLPVKVIERMNSSEYRDGRESREEVVGYCRDNE